MFSDETPDPLFYPDIRTSTFELVNALLSLSSFSNPTDSDAEKPKAPKLASKLAETELDVSVDSVLLCTSMIREAPMFEPLL